MEGTLERGLRHLVLLGDITDAWSRDGPSPVAPLLEGLNRLHGAQVRVPYIVGQHDMGHKTFGTRHWPALAPNAVHAHRKTVDVGPFAFYGIDYSPQGKWQEELDAVPPVDVLGCHQVLLELTGPLFNPQGSCADVSNTNLMAIGDLHKNVVIRTTGKQGQDLRVVSVGSTAMQAIDEPADKYYAVLGSDLQFRKVRLKTRPKLDPPEVHTADDLERLLARLPGMLDACHDANPDLPPHIRTPLLRVVYAHAVPDASRRLRRAVGDRAHLFEKELQPAKADAPRRVAAGRALTLLGCLPLVVDEKSDPDLYALARRALGAPEGQAEEELRAWVGEYLASEAGAPTEA